jgi:hypothetical protein
MFTARCKKCPKVFMKPTKARAEQALLMHVGRKHTNLIPNRAKVHVIPPIKKAKRKYTRRIQPVEAQASIPAVNFCCNCGFDQRAVAVGIAMAQQARNQS